MAYGWISHSKMKPIEIGESLNYATDPEKKFSENQDGYFNAKSTHIDKYVTLDVEDQD